MLVCWRNASILVLARRSCCLSAISPAFPHSSSRTPDRCRRAWQPGNWSSTEIGLKPPGQIDAPTCDLFGTSHSGCCAAMCTQALADPLRRVIKGPALMDLGGDARVQSIPRAANRTYGAEDTR